MIGIRKHFPPALVIGLSLIATLAGCQAPEENEFLAEQGPIRISWPESDREGLIDAELPPFELEDEGFLGSGRFNSVFWLDFDGATVSSRDSFIVRNAGHSQIEIPPFLPVDILSFENRDLLIDEIVQDLLPLFPNVDIRLTTSRPTIGRFSRVHIGGNNFLGRPGVLGVAPLDLGNRIPDDVLFVFSREMSNVRGGAASIQAQLVHVIAHEIGHAMGARHINNSFALMRPSVALEANSFNLTGRVTDSPDEIENSLQVLINSAGSRTLAIAQQDLPRIVNLRAFATDDVIQYSVISPENMRQNPGHRLADYRYQWRFNGLRSEGTSVLMRFDDRDDHLLELTVSDGTGRRRNFEFLVGHRR